MRLYAANLNPRSPYGFAVRQGAEVTDVLAPYVVLSESGAFNVYAVAPERKAVTLSGGLDVLPQLSLAELGQRLGGEDPVVIVVPEMADIGSGRRKTPIGQAHND